MSGIVYACVVPHGSEVIPELAAAGGAGGGTAVGAPVGIVGEKRVGEALAGFALLTQAMEEIGRRVRRFHGRGDFRACDWNAGGRGAGPRRHRGLLSGR